MRDLLPSNRPLTANVTALHPGATQRAVQMPAFGHTLGALLLLMLGTTAAHAECTWQNGASTNSYTFSIPPITVPRNAAIGTLLYAAPRQQARPYSGNYAYCPSGGNWHYNVTGAPPASNLIETYATNVPGIGVRFLKSDGPNGIPNYFSATAYGTYDGYWTNALNGGEYYGLEIVVTGPVDAGRIRPTATGVFTLGELTISNLYMTSTQVTVQTCQINAPRNIDLPRVHTNALPSTGSTAGETPFTITLANCPARLHAIQYQIDAPGGTINRAAGIFSAGRDSTVRGVGLVLTDSSGAPFSLGNMHTLSRYNASTGGTYPLDFNLAYYRTSSLSAGDLKAQITYTMSYQ